MPTTPPHAAPLGVELSALLGPGTRYEGTLLFEGAVRIDGSVRGKIDGGGKGILVVGEDGEVHGEVEVGTLIVRGGTVDGKVRAHQLVELHREGTLRGELWAARLFVEEGARLESRCEVPGEARHVLGTAEEPASAPPPGVSVGRALPEFEEESVEPSSSEGPSSEAADRGDEADQSA